MNNPRIAIFPGTFDPITKGHEALVRRALPLFDKVIIAVGVNSTKNAMFAMEQRQKWISELFAGESKVEVVAYEGLTIDLCRKHNARYILRGLRTSADFEYEKAISQMNREMAKDIETVFMATDPVYSAINSTIVREIIKNGGDISAFVPAVVSVKK
ncbi:MAG: pantetheine-phosphate adenylyltransferase [Bacteroidota bacterium]